MPHILKEMFETDILEEEVILEWSKKVSKKYVGKEIAQKIHDKAAPFITWLKVCCIIVGVIFVSFSLDGPFIVVKLLYNTLCLSDSVSPKRHGVNVILSAATQNSHLILFCKDYLYY